MKLAYAPDDMISGSDFDSHIINTEFPYIPQFAKLKIDGNHTATERLIAGDIEFEFKGIKCHNDDGRTVRGMMQGVSAGEATELADGLFVERAQIIRAAGVKKIIIGIPLMALPVVLWFVFLATIRFVPIKLWALTLMAGLYGMYCLFKGLIMFFSPKSEPGDCSEK
jgi:hypothetical protein